MKATPVIEVELCDGCGVCEMECPNQTVAVVDGKAVIVAADRCDYCTTCEESCPRGAISCPYEIAFD